MNIEPSNRGQASHTTQTKFVFLLQESFSLTQTFCKHCALTISDIDKGFFAAQRRGNGEHYVRFTFFDFDPCSELLSDIDILKLHYSMSDFPNPWMNTAQTPFVVCFGHTVNISTIFRLFKAIL